MLLPYSESVSCLSPNGLWRMHGDFLLPNSNCKIHSLASCFHVYPQLEVHVLRSTLFTYKSLSEPAPAKELYDLET